MIRKLFSLLIVALVISSCGNTGKKEVSSKTEGTTEAAKVEFASLVLNPSEYVGKNISVEGKVVHVCTQSGKKLFITGDDPNVSLYVQAGEEMPKFPMELLGSKIVVEGTITKATAMAMEEGEGMPEGAKMAQTPGADTCETAKALASQPVLSDLMMVYNKHTLVK
jgi:hypothetical protein